jgi:hypothetical protein
MTLIPLPAFQDDYLWALHDGQRTLVVDPGGPQLEPILVTHRPLSVPPSATRVGCTREYALSSLKSAPPVEPHNAELIHYPRRCEEPRDRNLPIGQ